MLLFDFFNSIRHEGGEMKKEVRGKKKVLEGSR